MQVTIYGRPGCPYCTRAIQIAEMLKQKRDDFDFTYTDMYAENISKEKLSEKLGVDVRTVPQVLLDDQYIGGCTEFEAYVAKNGLLLS
ncbi:GrxA family glutaredoxin [Parashewanella curva]|uniref:GrxA family glutaredoxin n=1 Tax=Parashewanella curva TaxID=2338552 RepID=A0A3L8PUB1_9GAMM|nr:GrxA family glutaredoxin [Parashewanella curva]RLV58409.1 GrxA family glutaredoxin [Parashewanella curva]